MEDSWATNEHRLLAVVTARDIHSCTMAETMILKLQVAVLTGDITDVEDVDEYIFVHQYGRGSVGKRGAGRGKRTIFRRRGR